MVNLVYTREVEDEMPEIRGVAPHANLRQRKVEPAD